LPGDLAGGNRPDLPGRPMPNRPVPDRPMPGRPTPGGNRPTPLPGDLGGNGNRPGRPNGGNRPGDWATNRPDRPGGNGWPDRPGRPGIGGNRPGIGDGNIWNSGNWNSGNTNWWSNQNVSNTINNVNNSTAITNVGVNTGGWGYGRPGWGYNRPGWNYGSAYRPGGWGYGTIGTGWCDAWNTGYVNPHYGSWYNGCWTGNWGTGSWWTPFAVGAATWGIASTIANWGLGYGTLGYSGGSYVNPYYASVPATVVAGSPYDYSQPVVVNSFSQPAAEAAAAPAPSDTVVDAALAKFKAGDYAGALAGFDKALRESPRDSVIHEVRALTLFALGRYAEAAAALNAVLATAPGMDWTTMSNLYGSIDAYTRQLRQLEDHCRGKRDDAAARFVLAYHYLVAGHPEQAADMLEVVVAKQPDDVVARQILESIRPPAVEPPTPAGDLADRKADEADRGGEPAAPETDLVGRWKAANGSDTVELEITAESTFTWKATPKEGPAVELSGTIQTAADAIRLESDKAGTMVGNVASQGPDTFEFSLPGAPPDVKPLRFERQRP
jgi:tetratricopeptide (TPR) repeat protein